MAQDYQKLMEEGQKELEEQINKTNNFDDDMSDGYIDDEEDEEISYDIEGIDDDEEPQEEDKGFEKFIPKHTPSEDDFVRTNIREKPETFEPNPQVDPYDTPLFPGGPLNSTVEMWKRKWEDSNLRVVEIQGQYFVFRNLNRYEYKQISGYNIDSLAREEVICETCVLWPQDYDHKAMALGNAGMPSTLAQIVMEESGFTNKYSISVL